MFNEKNFKESHILLYREAIRHRDMFLKPKSSNFSRKLATDYCNGRDTFCCLREPKNSLEVQR